ncbi:Hypothetical protein R9X50_00411100 [Acrodontium crateriforme]|uniref:Chromatin modification-related protein n=1 Tax=Acrodontium crateriforme TaxID=150365 RepID=A0AAQ3RCF7_9PEZI|nr:Hypothetical protein R9X50_00411100 [Acrodontium crateriforme]
MNLAAPEDAASVLEQFVHDVANTPAEITHLLEEIQAKDMQITSLKDDIAKRDAQLQKWVRINGSHVLNPKEADFSKAINDRYDKCEILQAEKCGLSEKALIVLERQLKRMDIGLRSLAAREEFPSDWGGPTLLSGTVTGVNTPVPGAAAALNNGPLQAVSGNAGPGGANTPNIANAAQLRMAQAAAASRTPGQTTPNAARAQRESSTEANKRRRLNISLGSVPAAPSGLRQPSLGPGTPKPGTPNPTANTSRAGSAQPRPSAIGAQKKGTAPVALNLNRKVAPHQAAAANAAAANARKRDRKGNKKNSDRRRQLTNSRATPSTNASLSDGSDNESSASPTPSSLPRSQADGAADKTSRHKTGTRSGRDSIGGGDDEDDENDDQLYCYCQKVSFGDMVGCDNDNCDFQWFHWGCVGLKSEPDPSGEWLCPTCRKLPRHQLVISKG